MLQKRLGVEYERWQQYLDSPTRKPLMAIVEQQLLAAHMPLILDKGFDALMAEKRSATCTYVHSCSARAPLQACLASWARTAL